MSNLNRAARAAQYVVFSVCALTLVSVGIGQIGLLDLYSTSFAFEPGPWFAENIAPAVGRPDYCIVIGASTAREGFDPGILARQAPGAKFVNAATTGGNIEVIEIQAQILARYRVRPKCVIVGVHPFLMSPEFPPLLASTGYLAHLGVPGVFLLSNRSLLVREFRELVLAMVLPLKLHADWLNKLTRHKLFKLQRRFRSRPLPIDAYQYFGDEFKSGANAHYDDIHAEPQRVAELIKKRYDSYQFESSIPVVSFRRALALIRRETEIVLVVTMPNQEALVALNAKGRTRYDEAIGKIDVLQIDCSRLVSDDHFIDDAHLDSDGRRILSSAIGKAMSAALAGSAKSLTCAD